MTAQAFWNWFEMNHKYYLFLYLGTPKEQQDLIDELQHQLHQYSDKLECTISGVSGPEWQLEIHANGNPDYFGTIEDLVRQAPQIEDWKFVAFGQPRGFEFEMRYKGMVIDPETVWFFPRMSRSSPAQFGLQMGFPDFDASRREDYWSASWEILIYGLGEKQAVLDIKHVEVVKLPDDPGEKKFIPLLELPDYIAWWNERLLERNASLSDVDGAWIGMLGDMDNLSELHDLK